MPDVPQPAPPAPPPDGGTPPAPPAPPNPPPPVDPAVELASLRSQFAAAQESWAQERAGLQAGLDDEGLEVARHAYGRLPAENRPEFAAWLQGLRTGTTPAPRALSPWFAPPAAPGASPPAASPPAAPSAPPAVAPPAPKPPSAAAPPATAPVAQPGASQGYSQGRIDEIVDRATRTGDWTEYNQHRQAILGQVAANLRSAGR